MSKEKIEFTVTAVNPEDKTDKVSVRLRANAYSTSSAVDAQMAEDANRGKTLRLQNRERTKMKAEKGWSEGEASTKVSQDATDVDE